MGVHFNIYCIPERPPWIHGKNAPLPENFLGSPLHALVETFWPAHAVLADEFR
ncbi:MAG TPA: hypothetical protein VFK05_27310 [Polyangiaceae bacterium]|nr:hypothetical protein [Polyangiaceae bacterium]